MGKEYWVLSPDNMPELMKLTGRSQDELETMWAEGLKFGHVDVFWRIDKQWFSVRVSSEYVFYGLLERSIEKAMEISLNEYKDGIRRD